MARDHFIFGIQPVLEALKGNQEIDKILVQNNIQGPHATELRRLIKDKKVSSQNLPLQKLNHLCKKNHQGVIAYISPIEFQPFEHVITEVFESGRNPLFLILDRVSDVGNFGAICRSASCSGVDAIIIPAKGSAQINQEAIKRSSGALLNLNVCRERDLSAIASKMKEYGLQIIACTEKTDQLLYTLDFSKPTAIVMGSEENGINSQLLKIADQRAAIPIQGDIESLNVSVSAGIALFEVVRQRLQ